MFSVIANIYNKKTKGPTLMEFFTATEKLKGICNHGVHYETPCIITFLFTFTKFLSNLHIITFPHLPLNEQELW
jgi:hypothetical protein